MYIQIHPLDNVLVSLIDLPAGFPIEFKGNSFKLQTPVAAKHKFPLRGLDVGSSIFMYGVLVGQSNETITAGTALTVDNIRHAASGFQLGERKTAWKQPDISAFEKRSFMGFQRSDGTVGTANY